MFRKIKKIFVNETIGDVIKYITKSKKLTNAEKISSIIKEMQKYFAHQIKKDANMASYEMHYESFMNGDEKNDELFKKYYKSEYENLVYIACLEMISALQDLSAKDLDSKKLSASEKDIVMKTMILANECGYTSNNKSFNATQSKTGNPNQIIKDLVDFADYIKNSANEDKNELAK